MAVSSAVAELSLHPDRLLPPDPAVRTRPKAVAHHLRQRWRAERAQAW
jgi:hypothetical protein